MNQFKVTAIGEILFDIYPDEKRFGGAPFNFIYHVWKILGKANFISAVGNDENGKECLPILTQSVSILNTLRLITNIKPVRLTWCSMKIKFRDIQ